MTILFQRPEPPRHRAGTGNLAACLRRWLLVGALLSPALLGAQESPATGVLHLTITGLRPKQAGVLLVALYDRESAWLTLDSARIVKRLPVDADSMLVVLDSLPHDSSYAIAVTHDKNGNDKLDMRWFPFPKPKEGAGVSLNRTRMGKPKYADARFAVSSDSEYQRIEMRY